MGVKIADIIKKKQIAFEQLAGKKIAVDFSNAVYQFLSSIRQRDGTPLMDNQGNITSHLQGILSRSCNLISQNIKICYIFDGVPPKLKKSTQKERYEKKEIAEAKLEQAKQEEDIANMLKYSKQAIRVTQDMMEESKELIKALGLPIIQAPAEADAQIAHCCKQQDTWAGGTTDLDFLLHSCPRVITNLTASQKKRLPTGALVKILPEMITLQDVLKEHNISQEQLICLGILIGTDYNKGLHGIGQKKALKIVQEYKKPKAIFTKHPLDDGNWEEIFDVFQNMKVQKNYVLEWSPINTEKVMKLLVDKYDFSEQRVLSTIAKVTGIKQQKDQKGLGSWM